MGSFGRTDAQKKQHKERAQPFNRQRLGLLEKKKDYVLRAKDYQSKQERLKTLRSKASLKNDDEFYFGMVNKRTKKGVAIKDRGNVALGQDVTKVLKTQDSGYIKTVAAIERKKLEELQNLQHVQTSLPGSSDYSQHHRLHAVFVDSVDEMKTWNSTPRPQIPSAILDQNHDLATADTGENLVHTSDRMQRKIQAAKLRRAKEIESRLKRISKLNIMEKETALHRQLMGKGKRKKVGVDKDGVAKYKWKQERRK